MDSIALGIGSGWTLAGMAVILLYRGRLVPRSTYDDVAHDRDEWRAESRIKDHQIAELTIQLGLIVKALPSRASPHEEEDAT